MVLAVTRDGRVVASGLPEDWLPEGVLDQLTNVVAVGLNYTMAAALTADGRVIEVSRSPVPSPGLTNAIALDVAGQFNDDDLDYMLAVTSDGRVVVWGYFGYPPSAAVPGVVTAAGGWSHIVALKGDGTVVQWDLERGPEPVTGLSNVVAVAAGALHSLALKADGTVVAWGENQFGQTNVPAGLSNVVAIAASEHQSVALKSDGTLTAWGKGYFGEEVTPPTNLSNVVAISSGGTRNVAIRALPAPPAIKYPNQVYTFNGESFAPVPGLTNVKAFAVEGNRVLAVTREGRVLASGLDEHLLPEGGLEQLTNVVAVGLNYTMAAALTADGRVIEFGNPPSYPQPPGLTNVIAIDVFGQANDDDLDHKLAVTRDGKVVVWGTYGISPPAGLDGVISAAGGWAHVTALKGDGTVVAWGDNSARQLNVPAGLNSVVAIAVGGEHNVALRADGTVVLWGDNTFGQLNVPAGLSNVVAIAASEMHTVALKSDGTVAAWGRRWVEGNVTAPAGLSNVMAIASSEGNDLALVGVRPDPPTLGITANSGRLTISLSGEPDTVYALETSSDLLTWHFLRNVTNATGSTSFEVENTGRQFFRAKGL